MHMYESIGVDAESGSSSGPASGSGSGSRGGLLGSPKARLVVGCIGLLAVVALLGFVSGGADMAPVSATTTTAANATPLPIALVQTSQSTEAEATPLETLNLAEKKKQSNKKKGDKKDEKKDEKSSSSSSSSNNADDFAASFGRESALPSFQNVCVDPNYTKVTLKTATESTMVALFDDLHGEKKFEASDVIPVGHNFLVVFDNSFRIGRIDQNLAFRSPKHQLLASSPSRKGDSGFEALVYVPESETLYVVVEAEQKAKDPFHKASMEPSAKNGEKDADEEEEKSKSKSKKSKSKKDKKGEEADKKEEEDEEEAAEPKKEEPETQYHAIIEEVSIPGLFAEANEATTKQGYTVKDRCSCEYSFTSGNKGFEGAVHLHFNGADSDDEKGSDNKVLVLMGLCEGNHCEGGSRGREVGNGRVVLMVKGVSNATGSDECLWRTVSLLALPSTAAFSDYSAIAIIGATDSKTGKALPNQYTLAVTSQESSQVWIGRLRTGKAADFSDWSLTDGVVYNFPRSGSCEIEYCNIEGISFLDDNMLVAVSDKMKGGGRQHYRCLQKDQSVHTFVLP